MFGFFAKAETQNQLRQDVLSGVEKICSPEFSSVKESLASLSDSVNSLTERFSDVEEWEQQAQRQERRRQTALETILENQGKILEELKPSPPLEVLEALAENLTLAYLGRPADVEFSILYGKLTDLLAYFGLSLVADKGSRFDPERHEACAALCDRAYPEDSVLEIVRPGFLLQGKVLRCAAVVVNRYDAKPAGVQGTFLTAPVLYRNQNVAWEGKLYD
jgi:molecular chaperone GrpE (heat shock protein)